MPADDAAGEKTEEATDYKRRKAREQGQIAKSRDLAAAAVLLGGMMMLRLGGPQLFNWLHACTVRYLGVEMATAPIPEGEEVMVLVFQWLLWFGYITAPFLIGIWFIAWAINLMQVGFLVTWDPLMPNLNRINPVNGLQRMFSLRSTMTLVFNLLKLALIVAVAYATMRVEIPEAMAMTRMQPAQILSLGAMEVITLGLRLSFLLLILGLFDYGYQAYQQSVDLRMSKQEIKEEMKQHEGSPEVRAKRREIQRQMAMQRMLQEVPQAEVVVRNPDHYAVALAYSEGDDSAPRVIAKGVDHMAKRILKEARKHGVPEYYDKPLARTLYKIELGAEVPATLYEAVSQVLAWVYRQKQKKVGAAA